MATTRPNALANLRSALFGNSEQKRKQAEVEAECGRVLGLWENYRLALGSRSIPTAIAAVMQTQRSYKGVPKNANVEQLEAMKTELAEEAQLITEAIESARAESEELTQARQDANQRRNTFRRDIEAANISGVTGVGAYSGHDRQGTYVERKDTGANVAWTTKVRLGDSVLKQLTDVTPTDGTDSKQRHVLWFDQRHNGVLVRIKMQTPMSAAEFVAQREAQLENWKICKIDQWTNPVRVQSSGKAKLRPDGYLESVAPWREYTLTLWELEERLANAKIAATAEIMEGGYLELRDWNTSGNERDFADRAYATYRERNAWLLEYYGAEMVRPAHIQELKLTDVPVYQAANASSAAQGSPKPVAPPATNGTIQIRGRTGASARDKTQIMTCTACGHQQKGRKTPEQWQQTKCGNKKCGKVGTYEQYTQPETVMVLEPNDPADQPAETTAPATA